MVSPPNTYDEWLAFSDDEREHCKHEWNAYNRDGVVFPYLAAARLAMQSSFKILQVSVGTYHGGEYLLLLTVSKDDFEHCPPQFESFEGFRVRWLPFDEGEFPASGLLNGDWVSLDSKTKYQFEIRYVESTVLVTGRCNETNSDLEISEAQKTGPQQEYVCFEAFNCTTKKHTSHMFSLINDNRCQDRTTGVDTYTRLNTDPNKEITNG